MVHMLRNLSNLRMAVCKMKLITAHLQYTSSVTWKCKYITRNLISLKQMIQYRLFITTKFQQKACAMCLIYDWKDSSPFIKNKLFTRSNQNNAKKMWRLYTATNKM